MAGLVKQDCREMGTDPIYKGFSETQLHDFFQSVCDRDDWRGPIDIIVEVYSLSGVVAAIEFYTATEVKVSMTLGGEYVVQSVGYRAGRAGP